MITVCLIVSALMPSLYQGTDLQIYTDLAKEQRYGVYKDIDQASDVINQNEKVANASVFMFWGIIGLIVYFFVSAIGKMLLSSYKMYHQVGSSTPEQKRDLKKDILTRMTLRIIILLVIYGIYRALVYYVIPFSFISLGHYFNTSRVQGVSATAVAILVFLIFLHILTITFRILRQRPRVFG